ncbi:MAG: DUF4188 domain-containing protein [Acidobacteriaceae bacterium]|nr:DUF4188 domain-containing protein [Acidobacteriaceae bacterium]
MSPKPNRQTINLSQYPDLVVIYLGMRVNAPRGLLTLLGFGQKISASVAERPDGLLLHEQIIYSLFPPHVGMRQYWRDFESLERWSRALPHKQWWVDYLHDTRGTGFWHEAYLTRGGMEGVYVELPKTIGFGAFAGVCPAKGAMFSARRRARVAGDEIAPPTAYESDA